MYHMPSNLFFPGCSYSVPRQPATVPNQPPIQPYFFPYTITSTQDHLFLPTVQILLAPQWEPSPVYHLLWESLPSPPARNKPSVSGSEGLIIQRPS